MKVRSKEEQKRRFMMVMPVLVIPFLTMAFAAFGGGSGSGQPKEPLAKKGLNIEMPDARLNEKPMDKLSYYNAAKTDSVKKSELMRNDPYYQGMQATGAVEQGALKPFDGMAFGTQPFTGTQPGGNDATEAKVYERLNALNAALNQPAKTPGSVEAVAGQGLSGGGGLARADIDRLEQMMRMSKEDNSQQDTEIQQLSGMLEQVLDIQYPERVKEKLRNGQAGKQEKVYSVSSRPDDQAISLLTKGKENEEAPGFYGLGELQQGSIGANAVTAVVHETQELVSGAMIKLRLTSDIGLEGKVIPKDSFIFGTVSLNGERLSIAIKDVRYANSLFPVNLAVYDIDGQEGIHIPGAISRDVAKQSAGQAVQGIELNTMNPTLEMQAASAGIDAARNLLSRKAKLIKVTVKAGYRVLLWNKGQER